MRPAERPARPSSRSALTAGCWTPGPAAGAGRTLQPRPADPDDAAFIAPCERADVIIDFTSQQGKTFTLTNDAQVPFPSGSPLDPADPTRQVMQFRVNQSLTGRNSTYDPASGRPLRGGQNQEPVIVRLADPATGALAAGVTPAVTRQLVLFEFESPTSAGGNTAGTTVEDLVNNSKWNGHPGRRRPPRTGMRQLVQAIPPRS